MLDNHVTAFTLNMQSMTNWQGAGMTLLNADAPRPGYRGSSSYGKILCVREVSRRDKSGAVAARYTTPGGDRERNDRDYIHTALRETAEEAGCDLRTLSAYVRIDQTMSQIKHLQSGRDNGFVFAVLPKNDIFPGRSATLSNGETTERCWLSLAEIRALASQGLFRGNVDLLEKQVRQLANNYGVTLA